MKKLATTLTALSLVFSGTGGIVVATPALAASSLSGALADCTPPQRNDWDGRKEMLIGELRSQGIKYESIDQFGNCFIVRTKNEDVVNMLFDPQSLNRVY